MKEGSPVQTKTPPKTLKERFLLIGPGLVAAATGVGAGDLVAALVAGTKFGTVFVWAIIAGAIIKYFLNEGVGRFQLASGQTILQGWKSLGSWALIYFGIYIVIWGFIYGAAGSSSAALAATAIFPQIPLKGWAILHAIICLLFVWIGRYQFFEKVMSLLTGIMFITVVGTAVIVLPQLDQIAMGLIPRTPSGSITYALGLIGGVGGSITIASYGYWVREKNWSGPPWIPVMRLDTCVAYTLTAIFTLSLLIVGAEFLYGSGIELQNEEGLIQLAVLLGKEFGTPVYWLFLLGFWSASFTSVLGVFNGVPYLFADLVRHFKKEVPGTKKPAPVSVRDPFYRGFLLWITFPPMLLLFLEKPVGLVILYGVLGSLFMPFISVTLLILLNSKKLDPAYRNRWWANAVLIISLVLFAILAVNQIMDMI
jgi:Mn2+/Fe2+ NRAMP family transporter